MVIQGESVQVGENFLKDGNGDRDEDGFPQGTVKKGEEIWEGLHIWLERVRMVREVEIVREVEMVREGEMVRAG